MTIMSNARPTQVHELKNLVHELFQQRDAHLKDIQRLEEEAEARTPSNVEKEKQLFPGDEVTAAREEVATLQVR